MQICSDLGFRFGYAALEENWSHMSEHAAESTQFCYSEVDQIRKRTPRTILWSQTHRRKIAKVKSTKSYHDNVNEGDGNRTNQKGENRSRRWKYGHRERESGKNRTHR